MAASIARRVADSAKTAQVRDPVARFRPQRSLEADGLLDAAAHLGIKDLSIRTERGKTIINGRARYQLDCDLFFDAVKEIDGWESEIVVDLTVERTDVRGYHTVQPGETLASIAKRHLGSAARERDIFEANRDRMNDPEQILPGQQLLIPRRR
jgi:nucleoid-associated protein YgaU